MADRSMQEIRSSYAGQLLAAAGIPADPPLLAAFASVPREHFTGAPPWELRGGGREHAALSSDPADLYRDVLVTLDADKGLNNGSPSLHAAGLHALVPRTGETALHIGAGTGYYSAILAELVGPEGRVVAVEVDAVMAARARRCLRPWANVELFEGNGADWPRRPADIVYVNFAVDRPAERWVDMLASGGRLLFPLGVPAGPARGSAPTYSARAGYLLVTRTPQGLAARFLQGVSFVWSAAIPLADDESHARLGAALRRGGGAAAVRSLRWKTPQVAGEWYSEEDWGLSTEPPGGGV
ncbi:protein-L-isoaspartate(D-aspartate) O-methyltransferase [Hoeflea marina]|uniref:Protein-L-isoaspartate O-methyltransferase n=1 Tax=Hoeflea marina TaxID=274592 RepID=A0A317PGF5_9HYPH|nr:methyltransferase domain-containing protein [Hoeflea marina]PWV98742.1 protein-L-isoaspartate(D-aspartate) O-methyltransferase [Hoeflea marina]